MRWEQQHTRIKIKKKKDLSNKYKWKNTLELFLAGHLMIGISKPLYFGFKKIHSYRVLIKNG